MFLTVVLAACSKTPESVVPQSDNHCPALHKTVAQCVSKQVVSIEQSKQMMAVLSEQLNLAPPVEQVKICQDAVRFWQAACGVTQ